MTFHEKLKTILETNAFDQLTPYKQPGSWKGLTKDERELLSLLFIKQGDFQLKNGDSKVSESFNLAQKITPKNPRIYLQQAIIYAGQGDDDNYLLSAAEALEKATELDPAFMNAWHSWGNVLVRMGFLRNDPELFLQANEKFTIAGRFAKNSPSEYSKMFFWHWGSCLLLIAKHSGEACDFLATFQRFRAAAAAGCDLAAFYNDFGNLLVEIADLLLRQDLLFEAAHYYMLATEQEPMQYGPWINLACTYQALYAWEQSQEYFFKADECFVRAMQLDPDDGKGWFRWASLYANSGNILNQVDRIQLSLEKFAKADACEPKTPPIQLAWGEALMHVAAATENLQMLRDAEEKIAFASAGMPYSIKALLIYGNCLDELGHYFASEQYYWQAIKKFEEGLRLKNDDPSLLYGMALAYYSIGELSEKVSLLEKSIHYFNYIAQNYTALPPQFLNDWGIALMRYGEMTNNVTFIEAAAEKFDCAVGFRLEEYIRVEGVEVEWLYNFGCAMDFLGDFYGEAIYYERAVQLLSHVVYLEPNYAFARYNLALALFDLGDLVDDAECFYKAIDLFQELIQKDDEDEFVWNDYGEVLLHLAVLMQDPIHPTESLKYFEQAENTFLQAITLGNVRSFYNLACVYALTDNPSAAIHYLERAEQCNAILSAEDVIHDEWLDNLRNHPSYRLLISRLLNKKENNFEE